LENKIVSNLRKVASEAKIFDKDMSDDLSKLAQKIASTLSDEELDSMINRVEKQSSIQKQAKLINSGDVVICVDNFPPAFKGRRYLVSDAETPGFLAIKELSGEDVGIFSINRFVLDNNEQ